MGSGCAEMVRSILGKSDEGWATSKIDYSKILIDVENASPSASEEQLYMLAETVLTRCNTVLHNLLQYGEGPPGVAKRALLSDSDEEKKQCLRELEPYIDRIKAGYAISKIIEQVIPKLLWELCSGPLPSIEHLQAKQSLVRQFARVVVFCLDFDVMKASNCSLVNHFSIFRRVASSFESGGDSDTECTWFLAGMHPMLRVLLATTDRFVVEHPELPRELVLDTLYTIIRVCCCVAEYSPTPFLLRVLVGCTLIFDQIHPIGSFSRESPIDMKVIVSLIADNSTLQEKQVLLGPLVEIINHERKSVVSSKVRNLIESA